MLSKLKRGKSITGVPVAEAQASRSVTVPTKLLLSSLLPSLPKKLELFIYVDASTPKHLPSVMAHMQSFNKTIK
jgi:hypothetical protein